MAFLDKLEKIPRQSRGASPNNKYFYPEFAPLASASFIKK